MGILWNFAVGSLKREKFWDMMAKNYDKTEKRFEQSRVHILKKAKAHLKADDIILDYGCGPGAIDCEMASEVKKIYAIDISSKMIDIAKRKALERQIANVDFAQAAIFDVKCESNSLDAVVAFNILHLLEDAHLHQAVRKIYEVLKPGGMFISSTPCLGEKKLVSLSIQLLPFLLLSRLGLMPPIKCFKTRRLDEVLARSGFRVVEAETHFQEMTGYFVAAQKV